MKYDAKYYEYLDALRRTGTTKRMEAMMAGAAPWLSDAFDIDINEARLILSDWIETFGARDAARREGSGQAQGAP